jgi:hypothetical protein
MGSFLERDQPRPLILAVRRIERGHSFHTRTCGGRGVVGSSASKHPSREFCSTRMARFTTERACKIGDPTHSGTQKMRANYHQERYDNHGSFECRVHLEPRAGVSSYVGEWCRLVG